MTAAGDYGGPEEGSHPRPPWRPPAQPSAQESFADVIVRMQSDRDRAVGAVLLLAYDGVISEGRARELLGMTIMQQRAEYRRIHDAMGATDGR